LRRGSRSAAASPSSRWRVRVRAACAQAALPLEPAGRRAPAAPVPCRARCPTRQAGPSCAKPCSPAPAPAPHAAADDGEGANGAGPDDESWKAAAGSRQLRGASSRHSIASDSSGRSAQASRREAVRCGAPSGGDLARRGSEPQQMHPPACSVFRAAAPAPPACRRRRHHIPTPPTQPPTALPPPTTRPPPQRRHSRLFPVHQVLCVPRRGPGARAERRQRAAAAAAGRGAVLQVRRRPLGRRPGKGAAACSKLGCWRPPPASARAWRCPPATCSPAPAQRPPRSQPTHSPAHSPARPFPAAATPLAAASS
jgi:hypothetical protein